MLSLVVAFLWLGFANAHLGAWHKGMYCLDGAKDGIDLNSDAVVQPLYQLSQRDWWLHHIDKCDQYPPPPGDFLDLPAGGEFQIEIASNRAKTSLSYSGRDVSDWPDGKTYPENYNVPACITSPNMHAQNQSMAAGTAFAISYQSDITKVTPENLVVFSVKYHTPWKRVTRYAVPAAMPACPPGGCTCAWGWIPNGCGIPNMYQQPFRCRVTGAQSTTPVATPKPPVWCEGEPDKCTKGAKQMLYWNQREGNNIAVKGYDRSGSPKSPGYNMKCGFADGAQNDIFAGSPVYNNAGGSNPKPGPSPSPDPSPSAPSSSGPGYNTAHAPLSTQPAATPIAPTPSNAGYGYDNVGYSTVRPPSSTQPLVNLPSKPVTQPTYSPSLPKPPPACRSRHDRRSRVARAEAKRSFSSGSYEKRRRDLHENRLIRALR